MTLHGDGTCVLRIVGRALGMQVMLCSCCPAIAMYAAPNFSFCCS